MNAVPRPAARARAIASVVLARQRVELLEVGLGEPRRARDHVDPLRQGFPRGSHKDGGGREVEQDVRAVRGDGGLGAGVERDGAGAIGERE